MARLARLAPALVGSVLLCAAAAHAEVSVERTTWQGKDALRLANGTVEVVVTTGIGPRIIRYAFIGGENILRELPDDVTKTALGEWKPWGGHRLWAAPEGMPGSYAPDNGPVQATTSGGTVTLAQPPDASGLQKTLTVSLAASGTEVIVGHALKNAGHWGVELAPWALTIMNSGGTVIIPNEPYRSHADELLPTRAVSMWGYTNLADPRWTFGPKFLRLRTDASLKEPQKIGVANRRGWAGYFRQGTLFVKRYAFQEGRTYPDFGVNTETFTSADFIELETLGPLEPLAPGATAVHEERWTLFRDVDLGADDNALETTLSRIFR